MKTDINRALRRANQEAGLPFAHAATNTDLLRDNLASRGAPFSFLDRPDTLLAKLLTADLAPAEGGGGAEEQITVAGGPAGDVTTYTFTVPTGARSLEIGAQGVVIQ